jgi:hypothetical protein
VFDDPNAEALLVEVPDAAVTKVEALGIEAVEPVHPL